MYDLIHAGKWLTSSQVGFAALPTTVSFAYQLNLMTKKTDIVINLVSEEHPFHQAQTRPGKAKKHRYERRKVRSILKVGDWGGRIRGVQMSGEGEVFRRVGWHQLDTSSSTFL